MAAKKDPKTWWHKYLFAAARKTWRWSPARKQAIKNATNEQGEIICEVCKCGYDKYSIDVDHRIPVVDLKKGFTSWDDYFRRLFINDDAAKLQILCKSCHQAKTNVENRIRRLKNRRKTKIKRTKNAKTRNH